MLVDQERRPVVDVEQDGVPPLLRAGEVVDDVGGVQANARVGGESSQLPGDAAIRPLDQGGGQLDV
ncbi:MAG: hypothetical protein LBR32_07055, partial [Propionibacteriaceae bacterium]|nr:hypothetical protein [Propionibacteriaceae bacterium]